MCVQHERLFNNTFDCSCRAVQWKRWLAAMNAKILSNFVSNLKSVSVRLWNLNLCVCFVYNCSDPSKSIISTHVKPLEQGCPKGALCRNWLPVYSYSKQTESSISPLSVSASWLAMHLVVWTGSSAHQGSVGVYTSSTGMLDQDGHG